MSDLMSHNASQLEAEQTDSPCVCMETETIQMAKEQELRELVSSEKFRVYLADESNPAHRVRVANSIELGSMLNRMKQLVRDLGLPWEKWCTEHVELKERTRQKYMILASAGIDTRWHYLGIEALSRVTSACKSQQIEFESGVVNGIIEIVERVCCQDIYDDADRRVEMAISSITVACLYLKRHPGRFHDKRLLLDACMAGLEFSEATATAFGMEDADGITKRLTTAIETGSPIGQNTTTSSRTSVRALRVIHQDIRNYHDEFVSGRTQDNPDKEEVQSMIGLLEIICSSLA